MKKEEELLNFMSLNELNRAKIIDIQKKNILPSKAAKICGYSDYSSFFRAYKKNFNISPNEDINTKQRWPMS